MISLTISRPNEQTAKGRKLTECMRSAVLLCHPGNLIDTGDGKVWPVMTATDPLMVKALLSEFRYDASPITTLIVIEPTPPNGETVDCTLYRIPSADMPPEESLTWLIANGERFADYAIRRIRRSL